MFELKRLKFSENLIPLVRSWVKNTTWRIKDDKNIEVEDVLSLCNNEWVEFGRWKVVRTNETTFGELSEDDRNGHEMFASEEEMLATYSRYYNIQVIRETRLKVIKFVTEFLV